MDSLPDRPRTNMQPCLLTKCTVNSNITGVNFGVKQAFSARSCHFLAEGLGNHATRPIGQLQRCGDLTAPAASLTMPCLLYTSDAADDYLEV